MTTASLSPPGPAGLPLVGHLPQFWRDRLGFLVTCAARYGDVVRLHIGGPTLLLTGPDDIRHVLVTRAERYTKTSRISGPIGRTCLGRSVSTLTGPEHHARRRALQPAFHRPSLHAFVPIINAAVDAWTRGRRPGERVNLAEEMRTLARRIMTGVLLGGEMAHGAHLQAAFAVRRRYHEHIVGSAFPMPQYQPARILFQYRNAIRQIETVLDRALRARRRSPDGSGDMLSRLLQVTGEDGGALSDPQIRAEALAFVDTGYETIAAALTWAWYLLARHPEIATTLESELQDVLGGRPPQGSDVSRLRYTAAVLKESLRLYPPTWNFARRAMAPDVLPCGVAVAPGTKLFLCQYIAHRNQRYFAEPDAFLPDRFLDASADDRPRYSYFPFGGGAHVCLGEALAELECTLVLASLAQRFRFELGPGQVVKANADFTLRPRHGLPVRIVARPQP